MSAEPTETASDDDPGVLTKTYRSVSPWYRSHPDAEMDSIGWAMFLGILVLLLPLLPFLIVVWVLERLVSAAAGLRGRE
jgi:hypothetical protein